MADEIILRIRTEGQEEFIKKMKEAGAVVEDVGDEIVDTEKKVEKSTSKMSGSFKKVGAAVAAAFATAAISDFIKESVKLADVQLKAEAQLLKALKGREDVQKRLINQAKSLQKVTVFGDEAIIQQQAFLAGLGLTEQQIKKVIKAAVDLSAGANISLESSVRNLAKTYSGLSGELGELVTPLRGLTQEQLKNGEAVELVSRLYEGQAEVFASTGAGSVIKLQNAFGDLREELGKAVVQGLNPLAESLQSIAENEQVIKFFQGLGTIIGDALASAGFAIEVVARLGGDLADLLGIQPGESGTVQTLQELEDLLKDQERLVERTKKAIEELTLLGDRPEEEINAFKESLTLYESQAQALRDQIKARKALLNINDGLTSSQEGLNEVTFVFINALKGVANQINALAGDIDTGAGSGGLLQGILVGDGNFDEALAIPENFEQLVTDSYKQAVESRIKFAQMERDEKITFALQAEQEVRNAASQTTTAIGQAFAARQQILQNQLAEGIISEKEYNEQVSELRRKQAVADKAQAVFQATLNIAQAVTKSFGQGGGLLGPAFAAISIAATTAQLATILATPIPQFAKGTKGNRQAPEGFAWVGEEGPELIQMRGGEKVITAQDSKELMRILAGYNIPVAFETSYDQLYKPMTAMHKLSEGGALSGIDWNPLIHTNERQRVSLGRKLDRLHNDLVDVKYGLTKRMTRN